MKNQTEVKLNLTFLTLNWDEGEEEVFNEKEMFFLSEDLIELDLERGGSKIVDQSGEEYRFPTPPIGTLGIIFFQTKKGPEVAFTWMSSDDQKKIIFTDPDKIQIFAKGGV